jgi:hypothetical protein
VKTIFVFCSQINSFRSLIFPLGFDFLKSSLSSVLVAKIMGTCMVIKYYLLDMKKMG